MDNGSAKASPNRPSAEFPLQLIDGALALAEDLFRDMVSRRRANMMLHEAASIPTRISTCAKEPDVRRKLKLPLNYATHFWNRSIVPSAERHAFLDDHQVTHRLSRLFGPYLA
ncbi:hypothetical protein PILCRDRAFT_398733 [Piloderma croceum F 1598]|uniref:Uncharacterized protein n=1 Tax=Piloderma croceum (strain F 1598) TaxID=765440 RepID=A0A0C3C3H0_PILCF|nr:hypothetical protein PILCRDRAFT_398733 [Piloderma croceum F 1598]